MTDDPDDVLAQAEAWIEAGEAVALATVLRTWGSAPRPAGSQLAVTRSGRMAGSVSGGCIEGAVAEAALATLRSLRPEILTFGVTQARAWEVGLACGGEIQVFVEPILPEPGGA
jgi:xanthine/CO dehydrogenase XdhC/CoxF family maturation factor